MSTYSFDVRCPQCAGPLTHVNGNDTGDYYDRTCAVAHCLACKREISIFVQMVMRAAPLFDHGTEQGYNAHRREGTGPCRECYDAHNAYHQAWRAKTKALANA